MSYYEEGMTVKDLKKFLKNVSDDAYVWFDKGGHRHRMVVEVRSFYEGLEESDICLRCEWERD